MTNMQRTDSLKAGIFITSALFLFALIIFVMGSEKQLFSPQEEFITTFRDIKGLSQGAPVRLAGITVGRVSHIGFSQDRLDTRVHVKFLVNNRYLARLQTDSVVAIETQGLLGDRFLNIIPGSENSLLPPGATINSMEASDFTQVLSKANQIVDNTVEISNNINEFVGVFKTDALDKITRSAESIANITKEIEKGNGLIHRLIYTQEPGGEGHETLQTFTSTAEAITELARSFSEITEEIKSGSGLANKLIYGDTPGGLDEIVTKLDVTVENLKKASEALASGSGTIGSLLIDAQLYDNLVEVTDGAKRSFLLRQAIRSSLNK